MNPTTVVIPVYNCEKFVRDAIESALSQSYSATKILLVDDGSTDNTPNVLFEYEQRGLVTVIRRANGGTAAAWNQALRAADTELLVGLDADDILAAHAVEIVVGEAERHPSASIVYSDYEFLDESGNVTRKIRNPDPTDPIELLMRLHDRLGQPDNFLPFGHVRLYRRSSLLAAGGFDESYRYAEDFELMLRLASFGHSFHRVGNVLYGYRWHGANKGVLGRSEEIASVRRAVAEFRARYLKEVIRVDE